MAKSSPSSEIFPKRLRAARDLRDLSQGDLAGRSGLQPSAVSHFETGSRKPSFDNIRRLADALHVTTDFLLGRVEGPTALAGPDKIFRNIELLSSEDRDVAEGIIEMLAKRTKDRLGDDE